MTHRLRIAPRIYTADAEYAWINFVREVSDSPANHIQEASAHLRAMPDERRRDLDNDWLAGEAGSVDAMQHFASLSPERQATLRAECEA